MITVANEENFYELIKQGLTIVDFYSTTCVPCKMFSRILEDIALEIPFVNIVKINISDYPSIGKEYEVEAVPTSLFCVNGEIKDREIGLLNNNEVLEKISKVYYGE